jgi:signal peptidase II
MPRLTPAFIVVIIDQFSKLMVKNSTLTPIPEKILGNILRFTYIENPGLAFGISVGSLGWLLFIITILITLYITYYLLFGENLLVAEILALNLILGGAIGNLIDRGFTLLNLFNYEGVIDFIDIGIGDFYRWPYIFNIADLSVSLGIIIFILSSYSNSNQNKPEDEVT